MSELENWENAYLRFETPEQEVKKFKRRLKNIGVSTWRRDCEVLEIFCGRGSGLHAWQALGFDRLHGLDLSERLLAHYRGPASCTVADARSMPYPDGKFDIVCVQGGLHHLESLEDLERALVEARRVLAPGGRLVLVEPWLTPFLSWVHWLCGSRLACGGFAKIDALASMIRQEAATYFKWLSHKEEITERIRRHFEIASLRTGWGKIFLVGTRRG